MQIFTHKGDGAHEDDGGNLSLQGAFLTRPTIISI